MAVTYEELLRVLAECETRSKKGELTLGEAFDQLKEASFSFICIVLSLPFLQPVPLGPVTVLGGMTFAMLGWQLFRGRSSPWLPERIRQVTPSPATWSKLLWVCTKVVTLGRRFAKPRLPTLIGGERGDQIVGILITFAGVLLSLPLPGIPFNNTLPAIAVISACIAELEDDGVFVIVSALFNLLTVIYLGIVVYALISGAYYVGWLFSPS